MPEKNAIKKYLENGFYHVYNRGINKENIFLDEQDYKTILSYMNLYLLPREYLIEKIKNNNLISEEEKNKKISKILFLNNFYQKIEILCYVFMPNHFHFILKQKNKNDMNLFIKSLFIKYTKYFNQKYNRIGHLFQSRYKAILIEKEEYFLHLSRYIHLNPKEILHINQDLKNYLWSSYPYYINKNEKFPRWLYKNYILSYFEKNKYNYQTYQNFVEKYIEKSENIINFYKKLIMDI